MQTYGGAGATPPARSTTVGLDEPSKGDQAKDKASQASSAVADKAGQAAEVAQEKAQQAKGQARSALVTQVDQRSTQAGKQVTSTAQDVRSVGQQLREQGKEQPAKLADQAADRVERLGNYLEHSDANRILGDVEDFARKQPWAVMFGGLAAGFLASRFLKASGTRRYEESRQRYGYASPGYTPARVPVTSGDRYAVPAYTPTTGLEASSGLSGRVDPLERDLLSDGPPRSLPER